MVDYPKGARLSTGLLSIIAVGGGDGAVIANAITAFTAIAGRKAIVRKIAWRNRTGGNGNLLIGFGDNTVAGSLFRVVYPTILMLNGIDGFLGEADIPLMGNDPGGFAADGTVPTGTNGNILIETDAAGVGAAPANVQVIMEIEVL